MKLMQTAGSWVDLFTDNPQSAGISLEDILTFSSQVLTSILYS